MSETNNKLKNKVAIVTGASRLHGIGAATCLELASQGADIFFTYWKKYDQNFEWGIQEKEPEILKKKITDMGVRCHSVELDLSAPSSSNVLFELVRESLGAPHILVNNACYSVNDNVTNVSAKSLDAHYEINVRATTLLSSEFIKTFAYEKGGRIINLTSGQSLEAMTDELSYAITKGAIETITYTLAPTAARKGITVNAINPGPTDTGWMNDEIKQYIYDHSPMGRIGSPKDAARLISFLASDDAEWVTGQIIHSEGGFQR